VEEVTDGEEDADSGLHLSEGEKEKWFGNGCWAVESIRCWVGLDPLAPFPFFFFFLLFFSVSLFPL
jgi:hypothetical protein